MCKLYTTSEMIKKNAVKDIETVRHDLIHLNQFNVTHDNVQKTYHY